MEQGKLGFAKVFVCVDLSFPPPNLVKVRRPEGEVCVVRVQYSLRPVRCECCGNVGHETTFCRYRQVEENRMRRGKSARVGEETRGANARLNTTLNKGLEKTDRTQLDIRGLRDEGANREEVTSSSSKGELVKGLAVSIEGSRNIAVVTHEQVNMGSIEEEVVKDSLEDAEKEMGGEPVIRRNDGGDKLKCSKKVSFADQNPQNHSCSLRIQTVGDKGERNKSAAQATVHEEQGSQNGACLNREGSREDAGQVMVQLSKSVEVGREVYKSGKDGNKDTVNRKREGGKGEEELRDKDKEIGRGSSSLIIT